MRCRTDLGPSFGDGIGSESDIYISDKSNQNENSGSIAGKSFNVPGSSQELAGAQNFKVKDIEVFKITFK